MDMTSDEIRAQTRADDSRRDAAERAVTGLTMVISGVGEQSPAASLAGQLREDFQKISYDTATQSRMSEEGWGRLDEIQRSIMRTPGLPQEQAFNLLATMAGVVSDVSTAGLVKTPERKAEQEKSASAVVEQSSDATRWQRYVRSSRAPQQQGPGRG